MTAPQGGPHRPNTNKPIPAPKPEPATATRPAEAATTPGPDGVSAAPATPEPATDASVAAGADSDDVPPEPGPGAAPAEAPVADSAPVEANAAPALGPGGVPAAPVVPEPVTDDVPPEPGPGAAPAETPVADSAPVDVEANAALGPGGAPAAPAAALSAPAANASVAADTGSDGVPPGPGAGAAPAEVPAAAGAALPVSAAADAVPPERAADASVAANGEGDGVRPGPGAGAAPAEIPAVAGAALPVGAVGDAVAPERAADASVAANGEGDGVRPGPGAGAAPAEIPAVAGAALPVGAAAAAVPPEPAAAAVPPEPAAAAVPPEPAAAAVPPEPAGDAVPPGPAADVSVAAGTGSDGVPPEPAEPPAQAAPSASAAPASPAAASPAGAPLGAGPPPPGATRARFAVRGIAGAAVLMAVVTVFARLAGFGRQLVFSGTVGDTVLGTAYSTVNSVPNIVFEIVAGGALASVVVPVLAGPVAKGAHRDAGRIASALLTWVVLVLTPIVLLGALLARPIAELLLAGKADGPGVADVASRMLLVFVPQVLLYGIAVVAGGILQAHHRFLAGTLAPLVSSLVVAGSYLLFANRYDVDLDNLATLPRGAELTLSLGTTAGVLALALVTVVPLRSTGLRLRPTLHFPDGVARRVRTLALAGVATLIAQQAATIAVILLANGRGTHGSLVVYQTTWMVYLLPYAVLAVPIATAAFPRLSAHAHDGDRDAFADAVAATTRTVLLVGAAGTALLLAAAAPLGRFFALFMAGSTEPEQMAWALAAFAPGLIGFALIAHLGRALNASGHGRAAAGCVVAGWVVVVVADVALAFALPARWTVAALGLGNSIGMTVAGLLLAYAVVRTAGPRALAGAALVKPAVCAPIAALAAGAAGFGTSRAFGTGDIVFTLIIAAVAAIVGTLVFAGVVSVTVGEAVKATLRGSRAAESEGEQRRGHDDGV